MAFSITCPQCGAILKLTAAVPAGKKVKCPKCGSAFATPALEDATAVSTAPLPPSAASDAEDAEPRRRKHDDDRDEPDHDDEPPSPRKRKKGGMGVGMLIGVLLAGGLLLFVGCAGCGGLGYWIYTLSTKSPIVGSWEQTNHPLGLRPVNTFNSDGRGNVKVANILITYKYRLNGANLTIEPDQPVAGPMFPKGLNLTERYTVTFVGSDEMILRSINNPLVFGEQHFRRLR